MKNSHYVFCPTSNCSVVYYGDSVAPSFVKSDLKVPVTVKDRGLEVPLCYCFHINRRQVLEEIQKSGTTDVVKRVTEKVKFGECFCEKSNPQGTCCLGNITGWIKEVKKSTR